MRAKEREQLGKTQAFHNKVIDFEVRGLVANLYDRSRDFGFVYDLNAVIRDSKEPLFTNHWIHCNARGNEMCAREVARILRARGIV